MDNYWPEFATFAVANTLSLISPGPDFLMVVRSSLRYNHTTALWVAFGIACGEMIHVGYSLLGIGLIISESILLFNLLKYCGAIYLIYNGVNSLRAQVEKPILLSPGFKEIVTREPPHSKAFLAGVLSNALNAKAAFFTISFFTVIVSPSTALYMQLIYAAFVFVTSLIWYMSVATLLSQRHLQRPFLGIKHWIERVAGAVLIILGLKLALTEF